MARAKGKGNGEKFLRVAGTILVVGIGAYILYNRYLKEDQNLNALETDKPAITATYAPTYTPIAPTQITSMANSEYSTPGIEDKVDDEIVLGSFNIQVFGESKAGKPEVMDALEEIILQYPLLAVQELRDASAEPNNNFECNADSIEALMERINKTAGREYGCLAGPRLGRTNSKEQYVFIYDPDAVQLIGTPYTYDDPNDYFHREPFIAQFRVGNFDFALVNIHTDPDDARSEIRYLTEVIEDVHARYQNDDDVIVLGDFNADGSYFNENTTEDLKGELYNWAIGNNLDTTVAQADNTYDRIVFKHEFSDEDFTGQAGAFYYTLSQEGTPFTQVILANGVELKQVSDHYPVWAIFYTNRDSD